MNPGKPARMVGTDTDIRAHRKAMDDLRQAKNDLEAIFDASQQAVFLMEPDGTVVGANAETARRLNLRVEDFVGKSVFDFLPADVAGRRKQYAEEAIRTRQPVRFEDSRADRIISQVLYPVFDSQGNVIRLAVYGEDVTEQRRSEQALRESEERYRRIVETASEGIWSMDGGYRTTYVNRHMADMLGYAPEEMIGRRVDAFMFAEDVGDHSAKMAIREKGEGGVYERRFRRKDGRELWTIVAATALKDAEGNFAGSFAMFTDVTERRQAEQALLDSEVRYRIVADNTYDWECWLSPDGTFRYSSPSCERITGYSAGDFLRRPQPDARDRPPRRPRDLGCAPLRGPERPTCNRNRASHHPGRRRHPMDRAHLPAGVRSCRQVFRRRGPATATPPSANAARRRCGSTRSWWPPPPTPFPWWGTTTSIKRSTPPSCDAPGSPGTRSWADPLPRSWGRMFLKKSSGHGSTARWPEKRSPTPNGSSFRLWAAGFMT